MRKFNVVSIEKITAELDKERDRISEIIDLLRDLCPQTVTLAIEDGVTVQ